MTQEIDVRSDVVQWRRGSSGHGWTADLECGHQYDKLAAVEHSLRGLPEQVRCDDCSDRLLGSLRK